LQGVFLGILGRESEFLFHALVLQQPAGLRRAISGLEGGA
jgi:hypothetical protein